MPNGECHVGATNKARIDGLSREVDGLKDDIREIRHELKVQKNLLIATLVGVIGNLIYIVAGRMQL